MRHSKNKSCMWIDELNEPGQVLGRKGKEIYIPHELFSLYVPIWGNKKTKA